MAQRSVSRAASLAVQSLLRREVPRFLTHIVTFRCNARCSMCDSWMKDGSGDLEASSIEGIYHKIGPLDGIRLTGGEPFTRPDFPRIVELAQSILKPLAIHVTTNGFLTKPIVDFCKRRDSSIPLQLMVSLDGTGPRHDSIRGRDGAFDRVMETLRTVSRIARDVNVRLSVNQTIVDKEGIEEISKVSSLIAPISVQHQVVLAYRDSGTYSQGWDDAVAREQIGRFTPLADLGRADIDRLLAEMAAVEEGAGRLVRIAKSYYRMGLAERLKGVEATSPPCAALGRHLRLLPDGSVPVCQFNPQKVGNLARQGLDDLLEDPGFRSAREWVRRCDGCWAECEVLPSAIYSGDLVRVALGMGTARKRPCIGPGRGMDAAA